MPILRKDILTLSTPKAKDVVESVRYAIKSIPHTYDRMEKMAWKRAARIARGKVNESLLLPALRAMGLQPSVKDKSYRDIDFNDFVLLTGGAPAEVDLKTFHVLDWFVKNPRKPITPSRLISSCDHTGSWQDFYPMLVPLDYKKPKDIFIFAISVEYSSTQGTAPVLPFSWLAFPEEPNEKFLIDSSEIKRREGLNELLSVQMKWPKGMHGRVNIVFERKGEARQRAVNLADTNTLSLKELSSLICVGLNDEAKENLSRSKNTISILVHNQADSRVRLSTEFNASRFREIFTRGRYDLHLVGWIALSEFDNHATNIARGAPCYFYPPRDQTSATHEPGTKTNNRYVLPQSLNPISTLPETFS
jgi:hypothetical protein